MAAENRRVKSQAPLLVPGQVPDPLRAHGAWVYLIVSILAGALAVDDRGVVPALLAGSGFVGVFVLAGSLAIFGRRRTRRRLTLGLLLTLGTPLLALGLGADPSFLVISLLALPPVAGAAYFANRRGFLSPGALACGVAALVVAAPTAASAGGAPAPVALLMLAILNPVFSWRTWRLARALGQGWTKERLQRRGLLESVWAVGWATLAVIVIRLLG
jgi:hypothetical protein